jgi:cytochrome c oxidase assembly factor CtaG
VGVGTPAVVAASTRAALSTRRSGARRGSSSTGPLAAWLLHALALWVWHIPPWFEAALASDAIHALQHASFLAGSLLYGWSVLGLGPRRTGGAAMISLFTTMFHTGALGALLTLSPVAWYRAMRCARSPSASIRSRTSSSAAS